MAHFDQRGQHVNYQYNAETINFNTVENRLDFVNELEKLNNEVRRAFEQGALGNNTVVKVQHQITQAMQEAQKPEPKKQTLLEHINGAKALIEGASSATGLVTAFISAAETAQKFFS